jgi:hypothetical protein
MWLAIYDIIREDFGFSADEDASASTLLEVIAANNCCDIKTISNLISGKVVAVVGAGPNCFKVRDVKADAIIAADGAMRCCLDQGVKPDIVVTDLDGLTEKELIFDDVIYVVHAHGDNIHHLVRKAPLIKGCILPTSQAKFSSRSYILGGFTDGDRAAFLAIYFKASEILLVGFDLREHVGPYSKPWMNEPVPATGIKRKKLKWAIRLLDYLRDRIRDVGR